jgi:hypothetical protein
MRSRPARLRSSAGGHRHAMTVILATSTIGGSWTGRIIGIALVICFIPLMAVMVRAMIGITRLQREQVRTRTTDPQKLHRARVIVAWAMGAYVALMLAGFLVGFVVAGSRNPYVSALIGLFAGAIVWIVGVWCVALTIRARRRAAVAPTAAVSNVDPAAKS